MGAMEGFRRSLADIGIEIPESVTVNRLKEILDPYLKGEKGDKMGQEVFDRLVAGVIVERNEKEG